MLTPVKFDSNKYKVNADQQASSLVASNNIAYNNIIRQLLKSL